MRRDSVLRVIAICVLARSVTARPNNVIRPSTAEEEEEEEVVEGPARDSPVLVDSDSLPAWKLPMEHRMGEAEADDDKDEAVLPDLRGVEQRVFDELGVGDFFSLWLVFLGGHASYSSAPFTVLAPTNASSSASAESLLLEGRDRAAAVVRAHIIMDEKLRPEAVLAGGELRRVTSGGQTVTFRIDANGEMWANEVPIVGWTVVDNGVIFALGDYLFNGTKTESSFPRIYNKKAEQKTTTTTSTTTTTTTTESTPAYEPSPKEHWIRVEKCESEVPESSDLFSNIVVCTEEWVDPKSPGGRTAVKLRKQVRKEEEAEDGDGSESVEVSVKNGGVGGVSEEDLPGFLQDIVDVLSVLRFGSNDFLQYIQDVDIKQSFNEDTKYTALIPFDEAFRRWYPIDWGFNPFDVEPFVRQTLLDHFLVGDVGDQTDVSDGDTYPTLGGNQVVFSVDANSGRVSANGVELVEESGASVARGSLLFVDKLLFVDHAKVADLAEEYPWLESGPLLPGPWYSSQFLSHALHLLADKDEGFTYMTEYLNATDELGEYAEDYGSSSDDPRRSGYTLLAPRDDAFWRILVQDATAPDPFLSDSEFRLKTMLGHLIPERLFLSDLRAGAEIATAAPNRTLTVVEVDEEGATLSDGRQRARIVGREEPLYDLGNVFFVDRVLFTETSDVVAVMEKSRASSASPESDVVVKSADVGAEDFGSPSKVNDEDDNESAETTTKEDGVEIEGLGVDSGLTKVQLFTLTAGEDDKEEHSNSDEGSSGEIAAEVPVETIEKEESKVAGGEGGASIGFPQDLDWNSEEVEEKVIFVNNQKISILTQKRAQEQDEEAKKAR